MILENSILLDTSPTEAFALIQDVERVAPCLPGAELDGAEGETYHGGVRVKVGPITTAYRGTVRFLDVDPGQRMLRIQARGADTHGSGDAEAEIRLRIDPEGDGARLWVRADLVIRGKIAQFGKGAISAVSDRLLQQFAANLAETLRTDPDAAAAEHDAPRAAATVPSAVGGELDGLSVLLGPAARYLPYAGAFALGVFQGWLLGRLSAQSRLLKHLKEDRRG